MKGKMSITVDGSVGTGKTEFIKNLQKKLTSLNVDCEIHLEPIEIYNTEKLLEKATQFPSVFIFQLQTLVMTSLFERHKNPLKSKVTVFERGLESSFEVFTKLHTLEKNLTECEWRILHTLYSTFLKTKKPPKADIHFFLRCPPEESFRRIQNRNQAGDKTLNLEYLKKIDDQYERYYSECLIKNKNLVVFDSSSVDSVKLAEEAARYICVKLSM